MQWIDFKAEEQLNELVETSYQKSVLVFKHSTRCGISRFVLKSFKRETVNFEMLNCYLLDILKHRELSTILAHKFSVVHQSPQLLIIKNGTCINSASHEGIEAEMIKNLD